ncbi:hypothetical protein ACN28S_56230 [Cystobacter fuscus]
MRRGLGGLLLAGVLGGCSVDFQGWAGMKDQPKGLPFRENAFFADGRTMRQPPPDTVPRSRRGISRRFLTGREAPDAGYVEEIPLALTREFVEGGRGSFEIYCATCHGVLGDGVSRWRATWGCASRPRWWIFPSTRTGTCTPSSARGTG